MKMITNSKEYQKPQQNMKGEKVLRYIALGFFDGVHLGHQALLKLCVEEAIKDHAISTVILFEPHPEKVIHEIKDFYLLTPIQERIKRIKQAGIQEIIVIDFNKPFQKITAENFMTNVLIEQLNMGAVFVGYNYHFGYQKKGDAHLIKKLSQVHHFKSHILEPVRLNKGQKISSTIIKDYIRSGDIEKANRLLGYYYQLSGKVIHGEKRGKSVLSFPTANIDVHKDKLLPKNGVYVALSVFRGKKYQGLVNIGTKPTFGEKRGKPSIEMYIFDFHNSIYNVPITILLLKKVREEIGFNHFIELKEQIRKDKWVAQKFFKNINLI